ncbi:hypothetical protein L208DRAFT_1313037 [Tricholoma matsutake]|nr:hypothetical protein L208DRAFT_1313037 [Tricholoma matsutake 945]
MSTLAWKHKTPQMKLDEVFHLLQQLSWAIADLLYFTFWVKDENGKIIRVQSEVHTKMASKFLGGFCRHSPAEIVELWVKNPWGIPKKG